MRPAAAAAIVKYELMISILVRFTGAGAAAVSSGTSFSGCASCTEADMTVDGRARKR